MAATAEPTGGTPYNVRALDANNYYTWAPQMQFYLTARGLWGTITGTDDNVDNSTKALAYMGMAVTPQHHGTILRAASAQEAWFTLKNIFAHKCTALKLSLRRELSSIKMGPTETLNKYFARAKTLQDRLTDAGATVEEDDIVWPVLQGLPTVYDTVITIMETTSESTLTLDSILPKLMQVEQRHRSDRPAPDSALAAPQLRRQPRPAWQSQQRHNIGSRPGGNGPRPGGNGPRPGGQHGKSEQEAADRANGNCLYCHKPGHYARDCRQKQRDQQHKPPQQRPQFGSREPAYVMTVIDAPRPHPLDSSLAPPPSAPPSFQSTHHALTMMRYKPDHKWIIDTGASRHITPNVDLLTNTRLPPAETAVIFGNGSIVKPSLIGDAYMTTKNGTMFKLTDVLYIPGATESLLSVSHATKKGIDFAFTASSCRITSDMFTLATVKASSNNIYELEASSQHPPRYAAAYHVNQKTVSAQLWHRRYAHLGYNNLSKLPNLVTGMTTTADEFQTAGTKATCDACALGKQHRQPFPTSTSVTHDPLELMHTDLCGPMPVASLGGSNYYLALLDDYTNFSFVFPIRRKSDAAAIIMDTVIMLERQTGYDIKRIRSDNGGEFTSNALNDFYASKGILSETTIPHTPQQNGKAERLNRTLMDKARPMLVGLRQSLWAEAVVTANYLRNRSPMSGLTCTPYEMFYGLKPDVSHLRTFGVRAFLHVPSSQRTKLDPTSQPGRFIGYATGRKGYKILLDDGSVQISRSVTFYETEKPKPFKIHKAPSTVDAPGAGALPMLLPDDTEPVGAPEPEPEPEPNEPANNEPQDPLPPDLPIALRRTTRAAAQRPAAVWQQDGYRVTGRDTHFANAAITLTEPANMAEAMAGPDATLWQRAMDEEMASLLSNKTWTLMEPPRGANTIDSMWVYKLKRDAAGNVERYKARLVVKGYRQREGIDYDEVFAPVSKYSTLRTVLSIAASLDLDLHQLDIKTAFLNGIIEEDVYVSPPPGYTLGPSTHVCKLDKALYGLKQAPRAWHTTLSAELAKLGFIESQADAGLFISTNPSQPAYLVTYVDDILIATPKSTAVLPIKRGLMAAFDAHDLGPCSFFLGMDVIRDRPSNTIKLAQARNIKDLLSKYNMDNAKPVSTPSSPSIKLCKDDGELLNTTAYPYAPLIGSLMYLSICTRPDIAQAVGALARYMSCPTIAHWTAAKTVVRYLAGTPNLGITFGPDNPGLQAFCDADFAGDIDSRRSTSAYVFILNGGAISWSAKLQPTVAASTTEAEYIASASAIREALWLRKLFQDLDLDIDNILIKGDNQAALKLLKNPIVSTRSKHIDVIHHFARERMARNEVSFEYIPTASMVADALTKPVPLHKFTFCFTNMGLID